MQPLRIRIDRIVDFGIVVSLVGIDTETAKPVSIHVDHRPFRKALREAGLPPPIEYAADRLMLHLDMLPDADAKGAQLIEIANSGATTSSTHPRPLQELDR
jgi:hypothetical protein